MDSSSATAPRVDRRLFMLALGMFAIGTDSFVVAGILPAVAHTFGVGIGAAGQLTTAYALTYAVMAPVIAALAGAVPRKRLMLTGLVLFVLSNLATAASPTLALALLTRVLAGVGAAMFSPTAVGSAATLVPPERRGHALSIVMAGLSAATALGAPVGAFIGGLGDWRWTMVFVSTVGTLAAVGIGAFLSHIPLPPAYTLRQRLAPVADTRVALTLTTTLLALGGIFTVYAYFPVVFDRAIAGRPAVLSGLLVVWGVSGTLSNLLAGRLIDGMGSHRVIVILLAILMADIALLPWSTAAAWSAAVAVAVWGTCGWGMLVPQQHRLVSLAPTIAPVLIGLNGSATYFGISTGGLIGAWAIPLFGAHWLGVVGAILILLSLGVSEWATKRIARVQAAARTA